MIELEARLLNYLPVGVWVARAPTGEVVYSNAAFEAILGIPAVGDIPITDCPRTYGIFDTEGQPYAPERLPFSRALAAGGTVTVDDLVIHRMDGSRVNVRAFATPVDAADGSQLIIVAFLDITAEVAAVAQTRSLQARAIEQDRVMAIGTLAASVAHEINNPLTYILGNLERIDVELRAVARAAGHMPISARDELGPRAPGNVREAVDSINALLADVRSGADRVQQVTRELRSFARPDDESVGAVDVRGAIETVLELVRQELEAHAELVLELSPTPPARANQRLLVQVILNLLVNAWQVLPESDRHRHTITLITRQEGDQVVIEIADTGPGIPADMHGRIFEPFVTSKQIGTGLGLYVCRNLVTRFGGDISAANRSEGGALFTVRLPIAVERQSKSPAPQLSGPPALVSHPRPRVLIIDDDELVAATLVHALSVEFEATAVHDSKNALALLLSDTRLDLVYCDLMMSGLTGMDIHAELSRQAPTRLTKLVFMTGGAFTPGAAEFVEAVGEAVVYKPFSILAETRRRLGLGSGGPTLATPAPALKPRGVERG